MDTNLYSHDKYMQASENIYSYVYIFFHGSNTRSYSSWFDSTLDS